MMFTFKFLLIGLPAFNKLLHMYSVDVDVAFNGPLKVQYDWLSTSAVGALTRRTTVIHVQ